MTRIIVDDELRCKLYNLTESLELCDKSGRTLARVTLVCDLPKYMPNEPYSEKEPQKRKESEKGYTTEQVLEHLRRLAGH